MKIIILFFTLSAVTKFGFCASIKFYDSQNFAGLFHKEKVSLGECTALPNYGHGKTVSLITDTCIILHESVDCNSYYNIRLDPGKHDNLTERDFGNTFNAFAQCTETVGGKSLNVELYYTTDLKDLAVLYKDVCGCIDMPNYVGNRQIMSLNNHGNCIKLYEDRGYKGRTIELPGGNNMRAYAHIPTAPVAVFSS